MSELTAEELRLLRALASLMHTRFVPHDHAALITVEDLLHQGVIALLEARKVYDTQRAVPFLSFARLRIRGEMMSYLREKLALIKTPQLRWEDVKTLRDAEQQLAQAGERATSRKLAARLGWTPNEVDRVRQLRTASLPFVDERDPEGDNPQGVELRSSADTEEEIHALQLKAALDACIEALAPPEDKLVLCARVFREEALRELAKFLGCSIERVRQREARAKQRLRECLEAAGWRLDDLI